MRKSAGRRTRKRSMRTLPTVLIAAGVAACSQQPGAEQSDATHPSKDADEVAKPASSLRFSDVTAESGIDFTMTAGGRPATEILEVKGGGLALIDYDSDGLLDLFIPNGATLDNPAQGPGCRLYKNLGGLTFRDVTDEANLTFRRWGMGVAVGDYDGDGFDDLAITCFGQDALLRNQGDGTFVEVTEEAGLAGEDLWGTGCAWGDLDGDGDLDLYVANFLHFDPANPPAHTTFKDVEVFAGPVGLQPAADVLYENLGDGTFRNVTAEAGCAVTPQFGLNVAILDFDADGKPDIFVGNDSTPNFMFHNQGGMRFREIGMASGIAANGEGAFQATMGIAIADVNGDLSPDVFTSNFSNDTNTLHVNLGRMIFEDRTQLFGLGAVSIPFLGWAAGFYDFGHDGWEDLIVFNGHVYPHATRASMESDFLQPPLLFERRGRRFERVTAAETGAWVNRAYCDRSAVFGDLDNDGDVDIIVGELNGPVRVLRNERNGGDWLTVELKDARAAPANRNHRAIGAVIDVIDGERTHRRWVFSGGSFQSASSLVAHFGFAKPAAQLTLRVTWPDGEVSEFAGIAVNTAHTIVRSDAGATLRPN